MSTERKGLLAKTQCLDARLNGWSIERLKVFISHSHKNRPYAESVDAELGEQPQINFFEFHRDIKAANDFPARRLSELEEYFSIVFICTQSSKRSQKVLFDRSLSRIRK